MDDGLLIGLAQLHFWGHHFDMGATREARLYVVLSKGFRDMKLDIMGLKALTIDSPKRRLRFLRRPNHDRTEGNGHSQGKSRIR